MSQPKPEWIITGFITTVLLIYYFSVRFTHDIKMFFGAARLASLYSDAIQGIDYIYEAKPIGNKVLFYGLYKLCEPVWTDKLLFEFGVKAIVAIAALAIVWWFSKKLSERYAVKQHQIFLISVVGLFTCSDFVLLQPEWMCIVIGLATITLVLYEFRLTWFLAGTMMIPLFLIKGISGFYCITVILAAVLILPRPEIQRRICWFLIGVINAGIITASVIWWKFPHFIPDVIMISHISGILNVGVANKIHYTIATLFTTYYALPIIAVSLVCLAMVLLSYLRTDYTKAVVLGAMWIVTLIPACLQSEWFTYHYAMLVFASIITLVLFVDLIKGDRGKDIVLLVLVAAALAFWLLSAYTFSWHGEYWADRDRGMETFIQSSNITTGQTILYLDEGDAPWYIGVQSECRFMNPFLLYFNNSQHDLRGLPEYNQTLTCVKNYAGEYIVASDSWLGLHTNPELQEITDKIESGYIKVWNRSFDIYRRSNNL